jgi:hypothetical protein
MENEGVRGVGPGREGLGKTEIEKHVIKMNRTRDFSPP